MTAHHHAPVGTIGANWRREGDELHLTCELPAHATGHLTVPWLTGREHLLAYRDSVDSIAGDGGGVPLSLEQLPGTSVVTVPTTSPPASAEGYRRETPSASSWEDTDVLKGLDPLLGPELLRVLAEMGHGDVLAVVDRNFPATSNAQRLVRLDGVGTTRAASAILSVLPVDDFVTPAAYRMEVVGEPERVLDVHEEFEAELRRHHGSEVELAGLERFEFYGRAQQAYAIVATGEDRPYGCFLVTKGVVTT